MGIIFIFKQEQNLKKSFWKRPRYLHFIGTCHTCNLIKSYLTVCLCYFGTSRNLCPPNLRDELKKKVCVGPPWPVFIWNCTGFKQRFFLSFTLLWLKLVTKNFEYWKQVLKKTHRFNERLKKRYASYACHEPFSVMSTAITVFISKDNSTGPNNVEETEWKRGA